MSFPRNKTIEEHMNQLCGIYGVSKIENNKAEIIDKVNSKNLKYIYILFLY